MSDFEIHGADQFLRLSKALKAAGRTELRKLLNKGMRDAAKPLIPVARAAFRDRMPRHGGLNEFLAAKSIRAVTRTGRDPGVKLVVAKEDQRLDTQGRLTHPTFGHRPKVVQTVPSGVFSEALQAEAPAIRDAIEQALERTAEQIVREVGR